MLSAGFEQVNRTFSTIGGHAGRLWHDWGRQQLLAVMARARPTCNAVQTHRVVPASPAACGTSFTRAAFGEVRVGVQYSYTQRSAVRQPRLNANGIAYGCRKPLIVAARANDNTILTSFRYYPLPVATTGLPIGNRQRPRSSRFAAFDVCRLTTRRSREVLRQGRRWRSPWRRAQVPA